MTTILADESIDHPIVLRLREVGYSVLSIAEMSPGIADDEVLNIANQHNALLITDDKDFGELIFRLNRISNGVVLLRLQGLSLPTKADAVNAAIDKYLTEMTNAFTVITPGTVRIRSQPL